MERRERGLGFKRIFERMVEGMSKPLLIKGEEAGPGHAEVKPFLFFGRIDLGGLEITALDEGVNRCTGNREEFRNLAHLHQRGDRVFFKSGT